MSIWSCLSIIVIILAILAFTPFVIPYGITEPYVLGLPRTLWAGMLISIFIYLILLLAMITSKDED
ncbi:MAG TPA: hypothetical protein VLB82_13845 [Thermodesulfobacteriota bacterium]|nr:hypothetical protein [Thermodesulfobacteriota bacterium]